MAKMRIHELSKELSVSSKDIIAILSDNGIEGKTASSGLDDDQVAMVKSKLGGSSDAKKQAPTEPAPEKPAAKPAAKEEAKPVPRKKPAAQAPADAPKKKKNITVVVNTQYSKSGNGGGRGHQDRRPRPGAERRPAPGQGGHSIIKPRPENERTRRSEATNMYPEQAIIPAPEKNWMTDSFMPSAITTYR